MCKFASWRAGVDCCGANPMPSRCDYVLWPHVAYDHFEMAYDARKGVPDETTLRSELLIHRRPVQMVLDYGTSWHTSLIVGTTPRGDYLVDDPQHGQGQSSYNFLLQGYGTGGIWRATYWQLDA